MKSYNILTSNTITMKTNSSTTTNSPEMIKGRIIEKVIILMIIAIFLLLAA